MLLLHLHERRPHLERCELVVEHDRYKRAHMPAPSHMVFGCCLSMDDPVDNARHPTDGRLASRVVPRDRPVLPLRLRCFGTATGVELRAIAMSSVDLDAIGDGSGARLTTS